MAVDPVTTRHPPSCLRASGRLQRLLKPCLSAERECSLQSEVLLTLSQTSTDCSCRFLHSTPAIANRARAAAVAAYAEAAAIAPAPVVGLKAALDPSKPTHQRQGQRVSRLMLT